MTHWGCDALMQPKQPPTILLRVPRLCVSVCAECVCVCVLCVCCVCVVCKCVYSAVVPISHLACKYAGKSQHTFPMPNETSSSCVPQALHPRSPYPYPLCCLHQLSDCRAQPEATAQQEGRVAGGGVGVSPSETTASPFFFLCFCFCSCASSVAL